MQAPDGSKWKVVALIALWALGRYNGHSETHQLPGALDARLKGQLILGEVISQILHKLIRPGRDQPAAEVPPTAGSRTHGTWLEFAAAEAPSRR